VPRDDVLRLVDLPSRSYSVGWLVATHFKADSHIACRALAVPMPFRALIHTCYAAPLPYSDSAVSFVNVHMVAGNIRLLVQQSNRSSFL